MVGMTQLDAGNIHLKAQKKNNVGYMPQVRHGPESQCDDAGQYTNVVDLSIEHIVTKIWIQSESKIKISNLKPLKLFAIQPSPRIGRWLWGGPHLFIPSLSSKFTKKSIRDFQKSLRKIDKETNYTI